MVVLPLHAECLLVHITAGNSACNSYTAAVGPLRQPTSMPFVLAWFM